MSTHPHLFSRLAHITTSGLALAASCSGVSARTVAGSHAQGLLQTPNDTFDTASGGARRLLDTSWHNPMAAAPGAPGLNAAVFHLGTAATEASPPTFKSVNDMIAVAATRAPTYKFVTTNALNTQQGIVFAGGDQTPTHQFLGALAAGAGASDLAPLGTTIIDLSGHINFPQAGTYQFNLAGADDAAAIFMGGNGTAGSGTLLQLINYNDGIPSAPGLPNPLHIDIFPVDGVAQTGWYPFEVITYNQNANGAGGAGLNWQVTGPAAVQFSTHLQVPQPPVPGPNPLHQYTFNSAGVVDSAPADQSNGALIGGASVSQGNLVTSAASQTQAAQVGDMGFFTGSFSLGHWFNLASHTPGYQTLFCFARDTQNYLIAHPQRGGDGTLSVEFGINGVATTLRYPLPALGAPVKLFVTYEGTTQQANLYVNDAHVDGRVLPSPFNLASISTNYKNVAGATPWHDPSLDGTTNQFNVYREAIGPQQITETQAA